MMYIEKSKPKKKRKNNNTYPNRKVTIIVIIIGVIILLALAVYRMFDNKKYQGYWCNYEERSSIVVLLEKDYAEKQVEALLKKVDEFDNVLNVNFHSRDDYPELGNTADLYDVYQISFSSLDSIGTYVDQIKLLDGVFNVEQNSAKINVSLYNIKQFGKYTFTDSDEAEEKDLETGKYKIKNGVIVFTPKSKKQQTKMLYIKNDHLCLDADCTKVFASSNETCGANE